ncbi:MAG: TonB-dependent receptor [Gammaproteobacteria bacterium]|nr:TonB-dependent receptor [Gammaproteobacteria bacterium]MBU2223628.1 TonB-dependent receptor [Gammaproteobacteria bacterium]MBU2279916.1 TonB-dependent receptor [Gammaproteobacteria bacterium]MBU2426246.1 TonB-dependent receptor [Gammaproteobacteria bacterium]
MPNINQFRTSTQLPLTTRLSLLLSCVALSTSVLANNNDTTSNDATNKELPIERITIKGKSMDANTEPTEQLLQLLSVAGIMNDPLSAAFSMPGVVYAEGDYGGLPAVRGSSPNDNAFLIDGLPAGYLFHIFGNSILNENLLRDFQLFPAAFGAEYGNATGGVFLASLRDPRQQDLGGVADLSFLQSGLLVEGALTDNQAFYASYRQSNLQYFLDDGDELDDDVTLYQPPTSSDYQARYLWQMDDRQKLTVTVAGARDDARANIAKNSEQGRTDPDSIGDAYISTRFDSQLLQYQFNLPERYQLQLSLQQLNDQQKTGFGKQQFLRYQDKTSTLQLLNQWHYFNDHQLQFGLETQQHQLNYQYDLIPYYCTDHQPDCFAQRGDRIQDSGNIDYRSHSAFVTELWQLSPNWLWEMGLRYEQQTYNKQNFLLPRSKLSWTATDRLEFQLKAGRYTRFGDIDTLLPKAGNPALLQPQANHFAIGANYQLANDWSLSAETYLKKLTKLPLALTEQDTDQAKHYSNDTSGEAYGVELLLRKDPNGKYAGAWDGWASLSWSKAERTDERRQVTTEYFLDTPMIANLVLNYQLNDKWRFGGRLTVRSGAKYTAIIGSKPNPYAPGYRVAVYGEHNAETLPLYHRLDIQADYDTTVFGLPATYSYAILNVLNRRNVSGYYLMAGKEDQAQSYQIQAEENIGIFPSIGIKVHF